jgi:invasion protein IalB
MSANTNSPGKQTRHSMLSGAMPIVIGVCVALLLIGAGSLGTVVMQHVTNAGREIVTVVGFKDWRVICPPPSQKNVDCVLNMDVARDQGGTLLRLSLNDTALNSTLSITVPHGVSLDQGLGFSVGGGEVKVRPYETCDPTGCLANLNLDEQTLNALKTSVTGQVVVAAAGGGSPVPISFSLNGFADGFAELRKGRSSRAFWSFLN